mmetsp:Transcript_5065/g.7646  ORF Transcript_5065/g.7646 Transcript_5065/m.7646 type:complete len:190 (+) Transcript_5065:2483-3052(+)
MGDFECLVVETKNKKQFKVSYQIRVFSSVIDDLVEEYNTSVISLPNLSAKGFKALADVLKHQKYIIPQPPTKHNFMDADYSFLKGLSLEEVSKLLEVSDTLCISSVTEWCCAYIAKKFSKYHPEYYRYKYNIPKEFSDEVYNELVAKYQNLYQEEQPPLSQKDTLWNSIKQTIGKVFGSITLGQNSVEE